VQLGTQSRDDQRISLSVEPHPLNPGEARLRIRSPPGFDQLAPLAYGIAWSAEWARGGFPTLQLGHAYAAALMSTAVPDADIRPPWPAYYLAIPDGLLTMLARDGTPEPLRAALVYFQRDRWTFLTIAETVEYSCLVYTLDELRQGEPLEHSGECWGAASGLNLAESEHDCRSIVCLRRLVLNACIAMSDPTAAKPIGKGHAAASSPATTSSNGKPASTPPTARVWELNRPVRIDCRIAVREYVRGGGRVPTVQRQVRGHWKQQPHGIARSMRSLRWIEPYWRGPDDGPLAMAPYQLGAKSQ